MDNCWNIIKTLSQSLIYEYELNRPLYLMSILMKSLEMIIMWKHWSKRELFEKILRIKMSRYTMGNGFKKWNYLLLGVIVQMFIFQMQGYLTLRKAGQSLFNKTLPCGFHVSNMCGKV